jgi:hypothetical protein
MSIITIDPNDSLGQIVSDINGLAETVGDISNIIVGDDNLVDAVNTLRASIIDMDESSEIDNLSKDAFRHILAGGNGQIEYFRDSGILVYRGQSAAEARAEIVGGAGVDFTDGEMTLASGEVSNDMLTLGVITLSKLDSYDTTEIINSAGTTILTLRTIA